MGEPLTWLLIVQVHFRLSYVEFMDVVRIFSKGGSPGNFPKIFLGGTKIGEICFFPLETKKTTLFNHIFKIQEALPPFRRPWGSSQWLRDLCTNSANAVTDERKYTFVANLYTATWKRFQNRCKWSACFQGLFLEKAFSLWCRNSKAFCERPFALQRQQPEKYK